MKFVRRLASSKKSRSLIGLLMMLPLGFFIHSLIVHAAPTYGPGVGPLTSPEGIYINDFRTSFSGAYRAVIDGTLRNVYCIEANNGNHPETNGQTLQTNQYSSQALDYILWKYGDTTDNNRAVAVEMLSWYYTQQERGSGGGILIWSDPDNSFSPIDPNSGAFDLRFPLPGSTGGDAAVARQMVVDMYNDAVANAANFAGPWTVSIDIDDSWTGGPAATTLQLRSANGTAMANQTVTLTYTNATGPATITTDASGNATFSTTPTNVAAPFSVQASASSPAPHREYTAVNVTGTTQRIAIMGSTTVLDTDTDPGLASDPVVTTNADKPQSYLGDSFVDRVTLAGVDSGIAGTLNVAAYGPFASLDEITTTACTVEAKVWDADVISTDGSGTFDTNAFTPTEKGYYTFVATWTGPGGPATHDCGELSETLLVYEPQLTTSATKHTITVGETVQDTVTLSGIPEDVTGVLTVELYGPFASMDVVAADSCSAANLIGTQTIPTAGSGSFTSPDFTVNGVGVYAFAVSWQADGDAGTAFHDCGVRSEMFSSVPKAPNTGILSGTNRTTAILALSVAGAGVLGIFGNKLLHKIRG